MNNLYICEHPFIDERLAILRNKQTPVAQFRRALAECGPIMSYQVLQDLPTQEQEIETPLEKTTVRTINAQVTFVAVLRAAIGFVEGMIHFLPQARIGHLGLFRDEETLMPVQYYRKLPSDISAGPVILADPMLATGGSIVAALKELASLDCTDNVKVATLIAAPEGIETVHRAFPDVPIFTATVDRQLNEKGYILPGLGDAGDRQYGTF